MVDRSGMLGGDGSDTVQDNPVQDNEQSTPEGSGDRTHDRDDRRNDILRALVEEHIRTGQPVSSKSVLDSTGLGVSGATIRNELAWLEREGFAVQPHTSAGRIPTARAYRYYVDHISPNRLANASQRRITTFYSSVQMELGRLLKATTELLADMTNLPAVAVGPANVGEVIRGLHLVQVGAVTFLVVVVTESGRVAQELCRIQRAITPAELDEAESLLAAMALGREVGPFDLSHDVEISPITRMIAGGVSDALVRAAGQTAEIYVGGTRQMATVWDNLASVNRVLEVLEREAELLRILATAPGTSIQIGDELGMPEDADLAMVSASIDVAANSGRVGVIGPMRMDYRSVISTVESVSRELGDRMES